MNKENWFDVIEYLGIRITAKKQEIEYYKANPGYTNEEKKKLINERLHYIKSLEAEIFYITFFIK